MWGPALRAIGDTGRGLRVHFPPSNSGKLLKIFVTDSLLLLEISDYKSSVTISLSTLLEVIRKMQLKLRASRGHIAIPGGSPKIKVLIIDIPPSSSRVGYLLCVFIHTWLKAFCTEEVGKSDR